VTYSYQQSVLKEEVTLVPIIAPAVSSGLPNPPAAGWQGARMCASDSVHREICRLLRAAVCLTGLGCCSGFLLLLPWG
jgi:hypothetical protein